MNKIGKGGFILLLILLMAGYIMMQYYGKTDALTNIFKKSQNITENVLEQKGNQTYLNIGRIIRDCTSADDCNMNITGCENKCICEEGTCKKLIF